MMGVIRKHNGYKMQSYDDKYRVAVHEIGHTYMALYHEKLKLEQQVEETEKLK